MKELDEQYKNYTGIDEAGRGCVGGSLFFVGAKLKPNSSTQDISFAVDSKSVNKKKHKEMFNRLIDLVEYKVVKKEPHEIDSKGLAICLKESLQELRDFFSGNILYDGSTTFKVENIETLVKADLKVSIVAAASIIAKYNKTLEDEELDLLYPGFTFTSHSGYINKNHIKEIIDMGFTNHHRKSYNIKALKDLNIKGYNKENF